MLKQKDRPQLSVILLSYQTGDFAKTFSSQVGNTLSEANIDYEIIIISNYKKGNLQNDKAPSVAKEIATNNSRVKYSALEKEGMFGWDLKTGLKLAEGEIVAFMDGDGQVPPESLVQAFDLMKSGNLDMVQARRAERYDGFTRLVTTRGYNFLIRLLFPKVKISDTNGKPKAIRKEKLKLLKINSNNWFIDAEFVIQAAYRNFKIAEFPIKFGEKSSTDSFMNIKAVIDLIVDSIIYRLKLFFSRDLIK